jgi:hypothetical protein
MATKKTKPRPKNTPSKPSKPKVFSRGGGDADMAEAAALRMDSGPQNFFSMSKPMGEYYDGPMTDEIASKIVASYRPVGELTAEDREARKRLLKRLMEFNSVEKLFPKRTEDYVSEAFAPSDDVALRWVVSRCVDPKFRLRLGEAIIKLIESGHMFDGAESLVIHTCLERLLEVINNPTSTPPSSPWFDDPQKRAQASLSNVVAHFIESKTVNGGGLKQWVKDEAERPHFKEHWIKSRRQQTPHNRTQFKFMLGCLDKFDTEMEAICRKGGPLNGDDGEFPPPRAVASEYLDKMEDRDPALFESISLTLAHIEKVQAQSRHALGTSWGYAWSDVRRGNHEFALELMEPFMHGQFEAAKASKPSPLIGSNLEKAPWGIAWRPLSNCLRTLMREWPFPPVKASTPFAQGLIRKHCQRS